MSTQLKCPDCGSTDIEDDPSRGDLCCTECGTIVEKNRIVSEVQFQEASHGASTAIGTFVSANSKGSYGSALGYGSENQSREQTMRRARNAITVLCNNLLFGDGKQHCIDTAVNFFKLALDKNFTKGRKSKQVHGACVYLTCRLNKTEHLLIDVSDVLQICCYQLGRTYLKLAQALFVNVPASDSSDVLSTWCEQCEISIPTHYRRHHQRTNEHKAKCCVKLDKNIAVIRTAFRKRIISYKITSDNFHMDLKIFMDEIRQHILQVIGVQLEIYEAVKINFELFGIYLLQTKFLSETKSFQTRYVVVTSSSDLQMLLDEAVADIEHKMEIFLERDSDPCLYIMRYAGQLQFGLETQKVVNTALRLVQRMKRDSIHSGRRPSGLCGAALLIAARLHEFGRSASDIVKIVKVHESTLRKRLIEFGDTPSSALTLDEFMSIDLEQELAPPSFKAARKKDRERLQKLMEEEADTITDLQKDIESQLNKSVKKKQTKVKPNKEAVDTDRFINQSTIDSINEIIHEQSVDDPVDCNRESLKEIGPDMVTLGLVSPSDGTPRAVQQPPPALELDMTFDDLDDDELDSYIMSEHESQNKRAIWLERNAAFLEEQKIKAEKAQKEQEEGKDKKKKRAVRRKPMGPTSSASESIEKIIQEKNISSKINYDVLKSLNASLKTESTTEEDAIPIQIVQEAKRPRLSSTSSTTSSMSSRSFTTGRSRKLPGALGVPAMVDISSKSKIEVVRKAEEQVSEEDTDDYFEEEEQAADESASEHGFEMKPTESDFSDYYEDC